MPTSLKSLLDGAKNDADETIKAASMQVDAPQADDAVMSHLFGGDASDALEVQDEVAEAPKVAGVKLASEGMKLAEALEYSADLLAQKLASDGSPEKLEANNSTTFTPAKIPATAAKAIPSVTADGNGVRTNDGDLTQDGVEGATAGIGQKTSAHIEAELVAARNLQSIYAEIGSEALSKEASVKVASLEAEAAKLAQDPSSPQPSITSVKPTRLATNDGGGLPVSAGAIPATNQGMIDLTTAQARDKSTAEAGKFLSETPKRDNAVKATIGRDDGLKVSSDENAVVFPATRL